METQGERVATPASCGQETLDVLAHRRRVGVVQQEPCLFDRSVAENIAYGIEPPPPLTVVVAAAKAAGVHDVIMRLDGGAVAAR